VVLTNQTTRDPAATAGLQQRLGLTGLDQAGSARLRALRPLVEAEARTALSQYFERLQNTPSLARLFSSARQIDRLEDLEVAHWSILADGRFDTLYSDRSVILGDLRHKIGLDSGWSIGAHALVLEQVIRKLATRKSGGTLGFLRSNAERAELAEDIIAVVKATLLDIDLQTTHRQSENAKLAASTLDEELEAAHQQVADSFGAVIDAFAEGRLDARIDPEAAGPNAEVAQKFNNLLSDFTAMLTQSAANSADASAVLSEVASHSQAAGSNLSGVSCGLDDGRERLSAIAGTIRETANNVRSAEDIISVARASAEESDRVVVKAIEAMAGVSGSAEEIGKIIGVIDEIAFQTNLLALNAGIEAARAGDAGRGFAVVATEVRALAQRSAGAAREIKELVNGAKGQVGRGVELVDETRSVISNLVAQVGKISDAVTGVGESGQSHADGIDSMVGELGQLSNSISEGEKTILSVSNSAEEIVSTLNELGEKIRSYRAGRFDVVKTADTTLPHDSSGQGPREKQELRSLKTMAAA